MEIPSRPAFGAEHGAVEDSRFKRALLKLMPGARRHRLLGAVRGARNRGDAVECPCCESTFSRFLPHRGRTQAKCPRCGALERHRVLQLFLERETDLFERDGAMLHVAPEYTFLRRFGKTDGLHYVTGDFDSALADHQLDVMDIPFPDESFDFLICNHVLEHVEDDRRALAEIHRVLVPGGWAILMCPVDYRRTTTLEDPTVVTPEDRHRVFGQSDHVRLYGSDYADRLGEAGFAVRADRYLDGFDERTIGRLGLRREEDDAFGEEEIFLCTKPAAGARTVHP
ncbi:MAG TPA: class I SAM-dependent methyltransferase [Solirubrobacterales bacterium]|nr:class I SAM-dependent methyltransferase [Solirubrobacterales bacterium]